MNRLERALWEALDVAIDRANEAEAELREWNKGERDPGVVEQVWANCPDELANLRADLEAVCRERDQAVAERDGYYSRLLVSRQERDKAVAELDKIRPQVTGLRENWDRLRPRMSIQPSPMESTPGTC